MARLSDLARKALEVVAEHDPDDAVVRVHHRRDRQVRFSRSGIDIVKSWDGVDVDLFGVWEDAVATTTVTELGEVPGAADQLERTARAADPKEDYHGIAEGPFEYTFRRPDPDLEDLDPADPVHAAIDAVHDAGAPTAAGALYVHRGRTAIETTGGAGAEERWGGLELSVRALDDRATGHAVRCTTTVDDLDPAEVGDRAGRLAARAGDPEPVEPGEHRVLFDPMIFATLLDSYVGMTSAFAVASGLSVFGPDDVGSAVASETVSIADDPTRRDGLGHRAFDDEGRPTQRVPLVEDGTLTTLLHNTSTAEILDADPTASAGLVAPEPSQIVLEPGGMAPDDALETLGDGLWLTNAWYTRYQNRTTGEFSTLPRDAALEVRDGEVVGAVTGIRISDNLRDLMGRVDAVGSEPEQVKWWAETTTPTFTPQVVVDDVEVTTSAV